MRKKEGRVGRSEGQVIKDTKTLGLGLGVDFLVGLGIDIDNANLGGHCR